jgi:hypothetical protein
MERPGSPRAAHQNADANQVRLEHTPEGCDEEEAEGPPTAGYWAERSKLPKIRYKPTPVRRALNRYDRPTSIDKLKLAAELRRLAQAIERAA